MQPTLQQQYKDKVVPALTKKRGYTNRHQVPRLEKIVVTSGVGSQADRKVAVEEAVAVGCAREGAGPYLANMLGQVIASVMACVDNGVYRMRRT